MKLLGSVLYFVLVGMVLTLISAIPIMFAWNAVMPDIFQLTQINYMEAWALVILSSMLFKIESLGIIKWMFKEAEEQSAMLAFMRSMEKKDGY